MLLLAVCMCLAIPRANTSVFSGEMSVLFPAPIHNRCSEKPTGKLGMFLLQMNGERGIRTLGTALRTVQQISNLPLSTTQPPLHY